MNSRHAFHAGGPADVVKHAVLARILVHLRGKPAPVTREVLQIVGRYAWYDTTKARTELGWSPRPLRETLVDTIGWLRDAPVRAAARADRASCARPPA